MVSLADFHKIDEDFEGVYLLFLKNRLSLDFLKKEVADKIWEYSNKIGGLVYIGKSDTVFRRIYANHLQNIGGSTLRDKLKYLSYAFDEEYIKSLNLPPDTNIYNYWLKNSTYFKVYKVEEPNLSGSIERELIDKYLPIFNDGIIYNILP